MVQPQRGKEKTSGTKHLRHAFLREGMGGIVMTVKDDEAATWIEDARATGREDSVVVIDATAAHRFNYMQYEVARTADTGGAGLTENLIGLFTDIMEAIDPSSGTRDQYWIHARNQLLRNTIDLALLAFDTVDLSVIYKLILEAPQSPDALQHPKLADRHLTIRALVLANDRAKDPDCDEVTARNIEMINGYWLNEYPTLAERTRTSIVSTFTSAADLLNRGMLWQLFSTHTTIVPEMSREGIIFILDLPVKVHHDSGVIAQVLFKHIWQRAMERPYDTPDSRPCFIWCDEYHAFAVNSDADFQATARSKQVATVYLVQNLPALYNAMGGEAARYAVDALLGNLTTHIFMSNGENTTNEWASMKISQTIQGRASISSGRSEDDGAHGSISVQQQRDYQVAPHTFTTLKTGGPRNAMIVEAIIFQTGRIWNSTRANYTLVQMRQDDF